jgi:MoxR-like ATPase
VPLVSVFAASNELPEGDEEAALQALADRFLLRYVVGYISSKKGKTSLLLQEEREPEPILTLRDLQTLYATARQVTFPESTAEALVAVVDAVRREGVEVSDRRMKQCVLLLRAKALLAGASEIEPERDFAVLRHALWTSPEQRVAIAQAIIKVAAPLEAELEEVARAAQEALEAWAKETDQKKKLAALRQLPTAAKRAREIATKLAPGNLRTKAERLAEELEQKKTQLTDDVLLGMGLR